MSEPPNEEPSGIKARLLAYQQAAKTKRALKKQRSSENLTEMMNASTGQLARNLEEAAKARKEHNKRPSLVGKLDSSKMAKFHDSGAGLNDSGNVNSHSNLVIDEEREQREASEKLNKMLGAVDGGNSSSSNLDHASRHQLPEFSTARTRYLSAVQKLVPAPLPDQKGDEKKKAIEREKVKKQAYGSLKMAWDQFEVVAKDRPREPTEAELRIKAEMAQLEDRIDKEWVQYAEKVVKRAVADGDTDEAEIGQWKNEVVNMQKESEVRRKQKIKQQKIEEEKYWKDETERLRAELKDESELGSDEEWESDTEAVQDVKDESERSQKEVALLETRTISPLVMSPKAIVTSPSKVSHVAEKSSPKHARASSSIAEKAKMFASPKQFGKPPVKPPLSVSERTQKLFPQKAPLIEPPAEQAPMIDPRTEKATTVPMKRFTRKVTPVKKECLAIDKKLEKLISLMSEVDGSKTIPRDDGEVRQRYIECVYKLIPSEIPTNLNASAKLVRLEAESKKKLLYKRLQTAWDSYELTTMCRQTRNKVADGKISRAEDIVDSAWIGFAKSVVAAAATETVSDNVYNYEIDKWKAEALRLKALCVKRKRRKGRKVTKAEAEAATAASRGDLMDNLDELVYRNVHAMALPPYKRLTVDELDVYEQHIFEAVQSAKPETIRKQDSSSNGDEDPKSRIIVDARKKASSRAVAKLSTLLSGCDGKAKKTVTYTEAKSRYIAAVRKLAPSDIPASTSGPARDKYLREEAKKMKKYEKLKSTWDVYESTLDPKQIPVKEEKRVDTVEALVDSAWAGFAKTLLREADGISEDFDGEVDKWRTEAMRLKSQAVARKRRKKRFVSKNEAAIAAAAAVGMVLDDDDLDEHVYRHLSASRPQDVDDDQYEGMIFDKIAQGRPGMGNPWDNLSDSEEEIVIGEAVIERPELLVGTAFDDSISRDTYFDEHQFGSINGLRVGYGNPWDDLSDNEGTMPDDVATLEESTKGKLGRMVSEVLGEELAPTSYADARSLYVAAVKRLAPSDIQHGLKGDAKKNALLQEARKKEEYAVLKRTFDAYEMVARDKPMNDNVGEAEVARIEDLADTSWVGFAKTVIKQAEADGDASEEYQDEIDKWKSEALRMKALALARKRRKKRTVTKQEAAIATAAAAGFDDGEDDYDERVFRSVANCRPGMASPWDDLSDNEANLNSLERGNNAEEEEEPVYGAINSYRVGGHNPWDDLSDNEEESAKPSAPHEKCSDKLVSILDQVNGEKAITRDYHSLRSRYIQAVHQLAPSRIPAGSSFAGAKNMLLTEAKKKEQYETLKKQWDIYEITTKDKLVGDMDGERKVNRAEDLIDTCWVGFAKTVVACAQGSQMDADSEYKDEIDKWKSEARRLKAQALKRKRRKGRKFTKRESEEALSAEKAQDNSNYDEEIYVQVCASAADKSFANNVEFDQYEDQVYASLSSLRPGMGNFWDDISDSEEDPQSKKLADLKIKEETKSTEALSAVISTVCGGDSVVKSYSSARSLYVKALQKLAPAKLPKASVGIAKKNFLIEESRKKDLYDKLTEAFDRYEISLVERPRDIEAERKLTQADDLAVRAWAGFAKTVVQLAAKEDHHEDDDYNDEVARWKAEAESLKAKALARKRRKKRKVTKDEAAAAAAASAGLNDREDSLDQQVYHQVSQMQRTGVEVVEDDALAYAEQIYGSISSSRPGMTNPWDDLSDASEEEFIFAKEKTLRPDLIEGTVFHDSDSGNGLYDEYRYASTISGLRAGQGNPWDDLSDNDELLVAETIQSEEKATSKLSAMITEVLGNSLPLTNLSRARTRYIEAVKKLAPAEVPINIKGKGKAKLLRQEAMKREKFKAIKDAFDKFEVFAIKKSNNEKGVETNLQKVEDRLDKAWSGFAKSVVKAAEESDDTDEEYRDEVDKWRAEAMRIKAQALARKRRKRCKVTKKETAAATAAAAGYDDGEDDEDDEVYRSISLSRPGMRNPWDELSDDETGQNEETQSEAEEEPVYGAINISRAGMRNPWDELSDDEAADTANASAFADHGQSAVDEPQHIPEKSLTLKERQIKELLVTILTDIDQTLGAFSDFAACRSNYVEALRKLSPKTISSSLKGEKKTEHLRSLAENKAKYESLKNAYDAYEELANDKKVDLRVNDDIAALEDHLDDSWLDFAKNVVNGSKDASDHDSDYDDEVDKWRDEARRLKAEAMKRKKLKGRRVSPADAQAGKDALAAVLTDIHGKNVKLSNDYAGAQTQFIAAAEIVKPGAFSADLPVNKKREVLKKEAAKKQKYDDLKDAWEVYGHIAENRPDSDSAIGKSLETKVDRAEDKIDALWGSFAKKVAKQADYGSDSESDSEYDDELDRWKLEAKKLKADAEAKRERRAEEGKVVHKDFADESGADEAITSVSEKIQQKESKTAIEQSESEPDFDDESESDADSSDSDSDGSEQKKKTKKKDEKKKKKRKDEKKKKKKKKEKKVKKDKIKKKLKEDTLGETRNMDGTLWKNPLRFWKNKAKVEIEGAAIIMRVPGRTDFWRKTGGASVADSGAFYWHKITGNFELIVKIASTMSSDMDKAGLMIRLDESNYIMTGMEAFAGRVYNSSLVAIDATDQSLCLLPKGAEKQGIWFCFKRYHNSYECFYSYDALVWFQTRQGVFTDRPVLSVGIAAACPSGNTFKANFEYYRVKAV
ncbi:hypothetical protein MPSEU_000463600 [Mayamaea pseudoterrestris]|nr:hypothetical protein MPSEU_000463600 [Mayamaea pseudoterrestris]